MDVRPRARVPATAAAVAALALVALIALGGCGDDDDTASPPTSPPTTVTTQPTHATSVTVTAPPTPGRSAITDADVLADGRWYGRITAIDLSARTLTFDLAQWFSGDGSDDYHVSDESHRLRTVPLAADVTVTVVRCPTGCAQYAGELEPLAASFGHETNALDHDYHGNFLGYWLTIEHGNVVRIDEQYTP